MDWPDLIISAVFIAVIAGCITLIRWLTDWSMWVCTPAGVLVTLLVVFGTVNVLARRTR